MNRLALRFALGILLAILVAFGLTAYVVYDSFERQLAQNGPPMASFVVQQLQWRLEQGPVDEAWLRQIEAESGMPVRIDPLAALELSAQQQEEVRSMGSGLFWADPGFAAYATLKDGRVLLLGPADPPMSPSRGDLLRILAVLVTVVGSFTFLLSFPVVRRLRRLERAALALGAGDLAARAPEPRVDDAVGQLTRRFNAMAGQLQGLLEDQQKLVQAVAHEIRTPIARLRFGVEMMELNRDPDEREQRRQDLEGDLEELESMVEELLVYSRYETGRAPLDPQRVPIRTSVERLAGKLPQGSPPVAIEPAAGAPEHVMADSRAFNRALRNMLANAARHAQGQVRVSWRAERQGVAIAVEDDGSGVPQAEWERIFQPFARLDASRDRQSGGVGLGLAIVQRIVEAHGGAVVLEDSALGGARFVTWWAGCTSCEEGPSA